MNPPSPASCPFELLGVDHPQSAQAALRSVRWLRADETVAGLSLAGQGNMNLVLRVTTSTGRSVILKQSRPWVEKYPQFAAPAQRIHAEQSFYEMAATLGDVAAAMPRLIAADRDRHLLVIEDLGHAVDFANVYASQQWQTLPLTRACGWLRGLHDQSAARILAQDDSAARSIGCDDLRLLNHAHIFEIPFSDVSPIDLDAITPGLSEVAAIVRRHPEVAQTARRMGRLYLNPPADCLLHGDFYPGSWLARPAVTQDDALWVIDAEFCFVGPREFDLAVVLAHTLLAGGPEELFDQTIQAYGPTTRLDRGLIAHWAGIEILRRLLGVAQLPVPADIGFKRDLVDLAVDLIEY